MFLPCYPFCVTCYNSLFVFFRYEIFSEILRENEERLHDYMLECDCIPQLYIMDWAISLFCKKLKINVCARVWDCILLFGEIEFYRAAVSILCALKNQLFALEPDTIKVKIRTLPMVSVPSLCLSVSICGCDGVLDTDGRSIIFSLSSC